MGMMHQGGNYDFELHIDGVESHTKAFSEEVSNSDGIVVHDFAVQVDRPRFLKPITLSWKVPALNVKGIWKPTNDFSKRIQADWELRPMESRISIDAPVMSIFGHDDKNVLTFSCSDAIHTLELDAVLREEDNCLYCHLVLFSEIEQPISDYKIQLRLDFANMHFSQSLRNVSKWWETFDDLKPATVPAIAKQPVYSTWYQFHQNLDETVLLKECVLASELGYKAIILDDGWQTKDTNRGYDFTGDWQPDRIPKMGAFVEKIHRLGMKVALWYSVPFCGKKSKAYQKFRGKFLTEDHRWAPVFDPRYPEVRAHLVNLYTSAIKDWGLDGFKLDFIDDFHLYPDTPVERLNGMDYGSVNAAVDRLLTDATDAMRAIDPEVFIEFRQKYTGPTMRKYGNMFRAFDCPGDAVMNRVRIADLRMTSGATAVHADMVTWHADEPVEVMALQLVNVMFGVPQLSIKLRECREDELNMIRFYTQYWNDHADILMDGDFKPSRPLANYPIQKVVKDDFTIIGVHDDFVVSLEGLTETMHFLNAQLSTEIIVKCSNDFGSFKAIIFDCQGNKVSENDIELSKGAMQIEVPPCGMVQLMKQS
jgi:alpha-galactosidase